MTVFFFINQDESSNIEDGEGSWVSLWDIWIKVGSWYFPCLTKKHK